MRFVPVPATAIQNVMLDAEDGVEAHGEQAEHELRQATLGQRGPIVRPAGIEDELGLYGEALWAAEQEGQRRSRTVEKAPPVASRRICAIDHAAVDCRR